MRVDGKVVEVVEEVATAAENPAVTVGPDPVLSLRERGRTFGPTGKGSGLPIEEPSEWKMSGRHLGSSNMSDEFLKCSIIDILPWIRA